MLKCSAILMLTISKPEPSKKRKIKSLLACYPSKKKEEELNAIPNPHWRRKVFHHKDEVYLCAHERKTFFC
jgi:hypothetical protein